MKTEELNGKNVAELDGKTATFLTKGSEFRLSSLTLRLENGKFIHIEAQDPDIDLIFTKVEL
ncbi:MAG: hypothetical protein ACFFDY_01415 [Candidatus Thorarchaeota archaeon]